MHKYILFLLLFFSSNMFGMADLLFPIPYFKTTESDQNIPSIKELDELLNIREKITRIRHHRHCVTYHVAFSHGYSAEATYCAIRGGKEVLFWYRRFPTKKPDGDQLYYYSREPYDILSELYKKQNN